MYKEDTVTALQWLMYSFRPMTIKELAESLTINLKTSPPEYDSDKKLWTPENFLDYCSSLVTQDDNQVIRFSHQSVKEYLLSSTRSHGPSWSPKRYASNYFWKHALLAKEKGFIVDLAMAVFSSQRPWKLQVDRRTTQLLWSECDLCRRHDEDYNAGRESRTSTLSLRYPSRTGLARVTEKLLHEWPNIDRHGRRWSSALVKSSKLGYYNIVKLLVEAGCDYNAKVPHQDFDVASRDIGAAVEFAAYEGHAKIVQTPGRVWWERREMRRCVGSSSAGSCEDTVRVIIDSYSAKHSPNPPYQKALLAAALAPNSTDTREILKVLVDAVSREAPKNVLLESPEILEKAVLRRDGGRVRTLCELGANINAIDGTGQSLLHFAADRPTWRDYAGGVSVIIALIYLGLGVNAEDHYGETPSHKSCISEDNEEREKS